jgi:flagellar secretion chaperone FliS
MYNGHKSYLENEVLNADPLKLVELLYGGALDAIHQARQHLAKREIRQRSQAITKAQLIIFELANSLDPDQGGAVSTQLARLYQYIGQLLVDANVQQKDAPLAEASQLLSTLLQGWQQCSKPFPITQPTADLSYVS